MKLSRTFQEIPPSPPGGRRQGRLRSDVAECDMGRVVDLSASGIRVRTRGRPEVRTGETTSLEITGVDGPFSIRVRAIWTRRVGLLSFEVGLEFVDPSDAARRALADLARVAAIDRSSSLVDGRLRRSA